MADSLLAFPGLDPEPNSPPEGRIPLPDQSSALKQALIAAGRKGRPIVLDYAVNSPPIRSGVHPVQEMEIRRGIKKRKDVHGGMSRMVPLRRKIDPIDRLLSLRPAKLDGREYDYAPMYVNDPIASDSLSVAKHEARHPWIDRSSLTVANQEYEEPGLSLDPPPDVRIEVEPKQQSFYQMDFRPSRNQEMATRLFDYFDYDSPSRKNEQDQFYIYLHNLMNQKYGNKHLPSRREAHSVANSPESQGWMLWQQKKAYEKNKAMGVQQEPIHWPSDGIIKRMMKGEDPYGYHEHMMDRYDGR